MRKILRNLNENDSKMLFNWRNHPGIRSNSFDKSRISLADHNEWFSHVLKSDLVVSYILEIDHTPVGAIRFDIEDGESAKINYLIDPFQQRKGFGTTILNLGIRKIFQDKLKLKKVYGSVLKENLASIKVFKKLSFINVFEDTEEIKFEKSRE